jgi:hypothetical protein
LHLDLAHGVVGDSSVTAATVAISAPSHCTSLPAGGDHAHRRDALHVLRLAGIDAGDAGVRVRRSQQRAEQHSGRLLVGRIFRPPVDFSSPSRRLVGLPITRRLSIGGQL